MKLYIHIFKFHALHFLVYPLETFSLVLRRTFEVAFLLYFWTVITGKSFHDIRDLLSYFLIGQGMNFIIMARRSELGKYLRKSIAHGEFSMYLIRPVNTVAYLYCKTLGEISMTIVISLLFIGVGLLLASPTLLQIMLFLLLLLTAGFISFAFNVFEGILAFYITKVANITNTLRRFIEVFSGSLVPLYYFPDSIARIVKLTPFPSMIYGASSMVTEDLSSHAIVFTILTSLFWALFLTMVMMRLWNRGLKQYEAIGI